MATTITIRQVPQDVRNELAARAARSGRSLQEYMLGEVTKLASKPAIEDWTASLVERKRRSGIEVPTQSILDDLHAERR